MDQVTNDRFEPRVVAHAKQNHRSLLHFEMIHRRLRKDLAKHSDLLHHRFTDFLLRNFLHRLRDKLEVGIVRNLKSDLVPDVRKEGPRVVVNGRAQHGGVGKLDNAPARMLGGKIVATEFPKRRVEIVDVKHIPGGIADLDPIADAIRLAHENVNPANKTRDRCLQRETEYQRDQTKRDNCCVPVLKKDGEHKERNHHPQHEPRDALQVVLVNRVLDTSDEVNIDTVQHHQADNNRSYRDDELECQRIPSDKTRELRLQHLVQHAENDQHPEVSADDKLVTRAHGRFAFLGRRGLLQGALHVGVLLHLVYLSL